MEIVWRGCAIFAACMVLGIMNFNLSTMYFSASQARALAWVTFAFAPAMLASTYDSDSDGFTLVECQSLPQTPERYRRTTWREVEDFTLVHHEVCVEGTVSPVYLSPVRDQEKRSVLALQGREEEEVRAFRKKIQALEKTLEQADARQSIGTEHKEFKELMECNNALGEALAAEQEHCADLEAQASIWKEEQASLKHRLGTLQQSLLPTSVPAMGMVAPVFSNLALPCSPSSLGGNIGYLGTVAMPHYNGQRGLPLQSLHGSLPNPASLSPSSPRTYPDPSLY